MTEGLTDREREILADGFQPHILRYDLEEKRPCDHCDMRPARYMVALGHAPENRVGFYGNDVCDVCLETIYRPLDADLPLAARLHRDNIGGRP